MLRFPPRRILVAVEFTKASLFAWEAAREIAGRFGASLEAVWCGPPESRVTALKRLRARLGPGARVHAVKGDPVPAIRRLARRRACDLIVMGAHRRPGLVRWVQGSVAEAVVHGVPCPVLIVPRAWRAPKWILAPVNDAAYARRGLLAAAVLARAYKARLALLRIAEDSVKGPYAAGRVSALAEKLPPAVSRDVRPELEVRVGNPVVEILRAQHGRDMIVLVAHRKSLLGDMVLGTTVERVLRHSRVPVLAIPSR